MLLAAAARIISTYVENTIWKLQESLQCKDHLHIRGEYVPKSWSKKRKAGSSPHTWRIQLLFKILMISLRIISTYVENTWFKWRNNNRKRDHLHIRGEYSKIKYTERSGLGSSPHTWRILYCYSHQERKYRIISTYVENTAGLNKKLGAK